MLKYLAPCKKLKVSYISISKFVSQKRCFYNQVCSWKFLRLLPALTEDVVYLLTIKVMMPFCTSVVSTLHWQPPWCIGLHLSLMQSANLILKAFILWNELWNWYIANFQLFTWGKIFKHVKFQFWPWNLIMTAVGYSWRKGDRDKKLEMNKIRDTTIYL